MKSKILLILFVIFFNTKALSKNVNIEAKNITLDKDNITTIFENDVVVKTENKIFKSDYVKYNKKNGLLILRKNISITDDKNNLINADYAEYSEKDKILKSVGLTRIVTSENYKIESEDIIFDNKKNLIFSKKNASIEDIDGNLIFLENFEYLISSNIFKSIGLVKIKDKKENVYEFSQVYIDTKKKKF